MERLSALDELAQEAGAPHGRNKKQRQVIERRSTADANETSDSKRQAGRRQWSGAKIRARRKVNYTMREKQRAKSITCASRSRYPSLLCALLYLFSLALPTQQQQQLARSTLNKLPDLTSATSDEAVVAIVGQDAFVSCVAKNLQNYTVIWRYTNDANAPAAAEQPTATSTQDGGKLSDEQATIITAGRQRVISDDRFSVIQSHDTWLLKISNVRLSDTGTYICHTNSEPRVRALRILSVVKAGQNGDESSAAGGKLSTLSRCKN